MQKNLDVVLLADFYGEMLTENQRKFIEYYYNDDLSLSEIAQNEGITRQGVRDAVKRAESQLFDMEKKLGFADRTRKIDEALKEISESTELINEYNMNISLSREVNDAVVRIKSAISSLDE
ncbi:MAG: YlxM family DNA-binding protein [Acutalibacteraceae bacterium]